MPDLTFKLILTTSDANVKLAEVKQEAESTQSVVEKPAAVNIKSHRKLQIRSPKIANAKTYTYPRIQLLPYVIRICILHISLRVYSLDSGADNSNYHLDKIVSNLQVLVIKTGKFTKTMSKWSSAKALRIFFCLFDLSILSK